MCQFSHLSVDEHAELTVSNGTTCLVCGHKFNGWTADVVYLGHETWDEIYDVFSLESFIYCPDCGERIITYIEICEDTKDYAQLEADDQLILKS